MSRDVEPGFCWSASSFWMAERVLEMVHVPFSGSFGYPEFQILIYSHSQKWKLKLESRSKMEKNKRPEAA